MPELADILSPEGTLAERLPGYSFRESQQRMAVLVADAIAAGDHAVIEAGTGIGKTFGYLLPVLLSGRRAIVSTGTRTLQDQLFARDLPLLGAVVGRPVEVALLKGRANYLCRHRLDTARQDGFRDAETVAALNALASWAAASASGDLTELEDFDDDHALRAMVTSTADNCLGSRCPLMDECFVLDARRRAQRAQVVIVNHHLLLADLALKEGGFGELLPGADAVIVDEAHQLPEIAQQFFGVSTSTRELESLARDVVAEGKVAGVASDVVASADALVRAAGAVKRTADLSGLDGKTPWIAAPARVRDALPDCRSAVEGLLPVLEELEGTSAGLDRCLERCRENVQKLAQLAASDSGDGLRWFDAGPGSVAVHWTPFELGPALAARIEAQGGAWIFASATLAVGEDFSHFTKRIGVEAPVAAVLPSPFDYERNARLFVPQGLPDPSDESYVDAYMAALWPLVEAAAGGAFLLFTSYRALGRAAEWIERRDTPAPGPLLVQGRGSRSELLNAFRADGDAVLLGTGSFWQGVDVRGRALRLVAIDKLPFASPGDPLVHARVEAIRRAGGDPFPEFQIPQAVLALKQGVGRLIRDFDDRGLVVIGDPRLRTRRYGRVFLKSLPPMPLLDERDEALRFAATLAAAPPEADAHEGAGGTAARVRA